MDIKPTYGRFTVYASQYCKLDSNVISGGGTDETETIQSILNMALVWGSLHLIVDGAALVHGIYVHSNTTIECLNADCGFYLADGSDDCIVRNAEISMTEITTKNICFCGGTYNINGEHQAMCPPEEKAEPAGYGCSEMLVGMRFFGVDGFRMEHVTIENQRRYALMMGNWKNVIFDDIHMPLTKLIPETNQDGLHFHAPGENLRITNAYGNDGDDFIAINTDEGDQKSSISGVVIDGVYLYHACQGIRLLCADGGTLENVSIRNVFGSVKSFGFFINPWFTKHHTSGKFRNISIENVHLKQYEHLYQYTNPCLFNIGGDIENLVLRNVSAESPDVDFQALQFDKGVPWDGYPTRIKNMTVDGLSITDGGKNPGEKKWITFSRDIDIESMTIRNVSADACGKSDALIHIAEEVNIGELNLSGIRAEGFSDCVKGESTNVNMTDIKIG